MGFSTYSGYISRFTGGFSSLIYGRAEFSFSDFLTLFPTVFFTLFNIVITKWKQILKSILISLVIPLIVGFSISYWFILRFALKIPYTNSFSLIIQAGMILWGAGVLLAFSPVQIEKILKRRLCFAIWLFLQIIGVVIMVVMVTSIQPESSINLPLSRYGLISIAIDFVITTAFILMSPFLPIVLGRKMADVAVAEKFLSRVVSITLRRPINTLGEITQHKISDPKKKNFWRNLWFRKSRLLVNIEEEVFVIVPSKPTYLVATFNRMSAMYQLDKRGDSIGKMVLIANDIIDSVELSSIQDIKDKKSS